jgi:hypothetical protein
MAAMFSTPFPHSPQQQIAQCLTVTVSDWAAIATAVGTFFLAIVAALQDKIRAWIMRPELKMSVRVAPPECHKTSAHFQTAAGIPDSAPLLLFSRHGRELGQYGS